MSHLWEAKANMTLWADGTDYRANDSTGQVGISASFVSNLVLKAVPSSQLMSGRNASSSSGSYNENKAARGKNRKRKSGTHPDYPQVPVFFDCKCDTKRLYWLQVHKAIFGNTLLHFLFKVTPHRQNIICLMTGWYKNVSFCKVLIKMLVVMLFNGTVQKLGSVNHRMGDPWNNYNRWIHFLMIGHE